MTSNLYGLVLRSFQIKCHKWIKLFFQYFVYGVFLVIQFILSKFPLKETRKWKSVTTIQKTCRCRKPTVTKLRKTSIPYLKYLLWIAKNHFKKNILEQASTCSREDVLTTMQEMTFDVPPEKLRNKSFQVSNDDGLKAPTPGTSATRKRKRFKSNEEETEYSPAGKTGKRSHHSRFQCKMPECNAVVGDIGRHLKIHIRKRELLQENLNAMIEIIRHGKHQFGQIKPRD